jgi:hypothetical protein
MYDTLLPFHSLLRWVLVVSLLYCLTRSLFGVIKGSRYYLIDRVMSGVISGVSHIQLLMGLVLYSQSPLALAMRLEPSEALTNADAVFFAILHPLSMIIAVVVITIGAAKAKRQQTDVTKHKAILLWFLLAFAIMLFAIPWQDSPYVSRPYFRTF